MGESSKRACICLIIDCPDDDAARNTEHALDHAYRVWRQYENLRSRMDDLAEKLR